MLMTSMMGHTTREGSCNAEHARSTRKPRGSGGRAGQGLIGSGYAPGGLVKAQQCEKSREKPQTAHTTSRAARPGGPRGKRGQQREGESGRAPFTPPTPHVRGVRMVQFQALIFSSSEFHSWTDLLDALEQRLQPVDVALAVAVQEGEDVGRGSIGTMHARPHQPCKSKQEKH